MTSRAPHIDAFLASLAAAFGAAALAPDAAAVVEKINGALRAPSSMRREEANRLPVCSYLDEALANTRQASPTLAHVADSFLALEPSLTWMPRPQSGPHASENWLQGHANATIVGPKGLEDRMDLSIGVSLLAPNVRYPDHDHQPEEVYLVLSPGRFKHGASSWSRLLPGSTFHNEPNMLHAMASDEEPLLAIWCLWIE